MKRTALYLLFALLLVGCGSQPQPLSELKSAYVTIDDSIRIHYKIWFDGSDAKTICFVHGFGCDMNTWEKLFTDMMKWANVTGDHHRLYK